MNITHEELGIANTDIENEFDKEKLLKWKQRIDEDIAHMGIQIDRAKTEQQTTGEYADPNWFHSIRTKKKLYGILSQKIQTQLGRAKIVEHRKFTEKFVDVCHRELDSDFLEELKSIARAEIQNDMNEYVEEHYL